MGSHLSQIENAQNEEFSHFEQENSSISLPTIPQSLIHNVAIINNFSLSQPSSNISIHLTPKRNVYTPSQRKACLDILASHNGNKSAAAKDIRKISGFEKVSQKNLRNWSKKSNSSDSLGGKVNHMFEKAVKDALIVTQTSTLEEENFIKNVSIAFTYEMIRTCAKLVQSRPEWKSATNVPNLKFSDHWVHNFIQRIGFSRKKITSNNLYSLKDNFVKDAIDVIKNYSKGKIVYNMDETGICLSLPTHAYCDKKEKRCKSLFKMSKERFTLALTVSSEGEFLPLFFILKSNSKDMKKYIEHFNQKVGFSENDGWEIGINSTTGHYFLFHKIYKHVITFNSKAWMNTNSMISYLDCIFGSNKNKNEALIMDNFSVHTTDKVKDKLKELGVQPLYLPPGTTAVAQPLDVFVNFQLKSALKRQFCERVFNDVTKYNDKAREHAYQNKPIPSFIPKQETVLETVLKTIKIFDKEFKTDKFKVGMHKTFENIGLIEEPPLTLDIGSLTNDFEILTFEDESEDESESEEE